MIGISSGRRGNRVSLRNWVLLGIAFSLCVVPVAAQGDDSAAVAAATVDDRGVRTHRVESTFQHSTSEIRVLLPERCRGPWPVLYVLPVEAGTKSRYGDAVAAALQHDIHNRHGLVCVFPTFSALPWYADHPSDASVRQETYFLDVVVPFIECAYPTRATSQSRLLVGFSKSGWGAFSLLLRHPDVFGKAAAWDAPVMLDEPGKFGSGAIFGTIENFRQCQISRLVTQQADQFGDGERLLLAGEETFGRHHAVLHALMDRLGVSHVYRNRRHGPHTWHSGWLPEAVELLMQQDTANSHSCK